MMGSKRSLKSKKKILDVDTTKKDSDLEEKISQQARMSWKLKYELINSDQFSNGMEEGKGSSEEEERTNDVKTPEVIEKKEKPVEEKPKEPKQKTTVIAGLSGYLSSSDSDGDSSDQEVDIKGEVQAFLKEVDEIKLDSNGKPIEEGNEKKQGQKPTSEAAAIDQQQQAMKDYYAAHGYSMPTTSWQECYDSSSGYSYYWHMDSNEVRWEIPAEYQTYITSVKQQWEEYHRALYRNQFTTSQGASVRFSTGQNTATQVAILQNAAALAASALANTNSLSQKSSRLTSQTPAASSTPCSKNKKRPPHLSDSEEDEKIELITSYGPNSDDPSSEDDKSTEVVDQKKVKKKKTKHSRGGDDSDQEVSLGSHKLSYVPDKGPPGMEEDSEETERQEEIKRRLASRQEDMKKLLAFKKEEAIKNKKRLTEFSKDEPSKKKQALENDVVSTAAGPPAEKPQDVPPLLYKPELPTDTDVPSPGEAELVERLKSQAEVLKKLGGELPEGVTRIIFEQCAKADDPKEEASLVAEYDEDLDSESEDKEDTGSECKSVIKQEGSKEDSVKIETKEDNAKQDLKQATAPGERVSKKVIKLSAKAKQLINASETTKRARQTDFVDTPHGLRPASLSIIDDNSSDQSDGSKSNGADEKSTINIGDEKLKRAGFGYSSENADKLKSTSINFVCGSSSGKESGYDAEGESEFDIKDCSELLLDKMKFLSEGKEPPSPVQIWAEQLEILYKAWEGGCLKAEFLSRWLQTVNERLAQLESTAAPQGWLCLWNREERRYSYKKIESGEVVWEFPVDERDCEGEKRSDGEVGGGEEVLDLGEGQGEVEMELCTTPPPPPSPPPSPPPPPIISDTAPSPPPPPIISSSGGPVTLENAPPLPEDAPPPLPEDAPPPLPEEAPPLPLDEAPPLPPGEPLPPGLEPPQPPGVFPSPRAQGPPTPIPPPPQAVPPPPQAVPPPPQAVPPPLPHRALLPHPPPPQVQPDYGHMVITPSHYHHLSYHQIHYTTPQSQYSSTYVSAAPMPAPIPPKVVDVEKKGDLSSELDSFYSDLATLEPGEVEEPSSSVTGVSEETTTPPLLHSPEPPPPTSSSPDPVSVKKRKKPKLAPGLALKKKGVSSLVAKWQKVQQSARRDF